MPSLQWSGIRYGRNDVHSGHFIELSIADRVIQIKVDYAFPRGESCADIGNQCLYLWCPVRSADHRAKHISDHNRFDVVPATHIVVYSDHDTAALLSIGSSLSHFETPHCIQRFHIRTATGCISNASYCFCVHHGDTFCCSSIFGDDVWL